MVVAAVAGLFVSSSSVPAYLNVSTFAKFYLAQVASWNELSLFKIPLVILTGESTLIELLRLKRVALAWGALVMAFVLAVVALTAALTDFGILTIRHNYFKLILFYIYYFN